MNINADCGSTKPESLQQAVMEHHADCGMAFDGDADGLIAVDNLGRIVDGDQMLVICGSFFKPEGTSRGQHLHSVRSSAISGLELA